MSKSNLKKQKNSARTSSADAKKPSGRYDLCFAAVLLVVITLFSFSNGYKVAAMLCCLTAVLLMLFKKSAAVLNESLTVPAVLFAAFAVILGAGAFWAVSGRFFLQEYAKILICVMVFFAVFLYTYRGERQKRNIAGGIAVASSVYAVLSVEAASTGLTNAVLQSVDGYTGLFMGFEAGTRLTGIFGNANIFSNVLGLGIIFSIYMTITGESKKERIVFAAVSSLNAFAFLLAFSMGGTAMFLLAIICFLIFSGECRGQCFVRMLCTAVPTVVFAALSFKFFGAGVLPLIFMLLNAACVCALEAFAAQPMAETLERREKAMLIVTAAAIIAVIGYAAAGLSVTGPYTFGSGETLSRAAYLPAGEHILNTESGGDVNVTVASQNMNEVMMHKNTVLYSGAASNAAFTVPENSEVVWFEFTGDQGTVISSAVINETESLKLDYRILPDFIANRLQGLRANQNAIQRTVFFRDGIRLFSKSPVTGNGLGSFESASDGVKDFYYQTKYVHNHYIQVLLESGILGFAAYMLMLISLLVILIKNRCGMSGGLRGALTAAFVLVCGHSAVEVTLSTVVCMIPSFAVFAMIACAGEKHIKKRAAAGTRFSVSALCVVYAVLIVLNIAGVSVASGYASSEAEYRKNLKTALSIDHFERSSYLYSYVTHALSTGDTKTLEAAGEFADELMKIPSNNTAPVLTAYFMETGQYEKAVAAAENGIEYGKSNPGIWNGCLQAFVRDDAFWKAYAESGDSVLTDGLERIFTELDSYNDGRMEQIELTEQAEALKLRLSE